MHRKHEATQTVAVFRLWEDFCQQNFCRAGGENARRSYSTKRKIQMERIKFGKNEVIFRQGDPSGCMYRIESGKVGIVLDYESTVETDLTELAAGQFLGEMGLIEKTARSATAISLSDDTELQVIDEENVARWFAENPKEMRYLLQQMSLRLRRTSRDYADVCRTVNDVVEAEKAGTQKDPALQNRIMKTLAGFEAFRLEGSREGEEA